MQKLPNKAAKIEASNIPNLASSIGSGVLKERPAINNDIVNPMPAKNPTAKTLGIVIPVGNEIQFNFFASPVDK